MKSMSTKYMVFCSLGGGQTVGKGSRRLDGGSDEGPPCITSHNLILVLYISSGT